VGDWYSLTVEVAEAGVYSGSFFGSSHHGGQLRFDVDYQVRHTALSDKLCAAPSQYTLSIYMWHRVSIVGASWARATTGDSCDLTSITRCDTLYAALSMQYICTTTAPTPVATAATRCDLL
jgi:hypothetical protein